MTIQPELQQQSLPEEADLALRVAELEAELGGAREEQLRQMAEMDNLRKRLIREAEAMRKFANERVLVDLLPVTDSLEAGLQAAAGDPAQLREGMELTLRQLEKALAAHGLSVIDPAGERFDPQLHQAMSMVDVPSVLPGTVVSVFQKGYRLNERLLRPALVTVAIERV